jgi:predicted transcriptional regulator
MPISNDALKAKIVKEMNGKGMVTDGEFAKAADLAEAIANAVVDEITTNGLVVIDKGSSAGSYKIT